MNIRLDIRLTSLRQHTGNVFALMHEVSLGSALHECEMLHVKVFENMSIPFPAIERGPGTVAIMLVPEKTNIKEFRTTQSVPEWVHIVTENKMYYLKQHVLDVMKK